MDNTTIRQTKARGMDAYSITIGKTSYYFIYSSEFYYMPKIIQVTIDGKQTFMYAYDPFCHSNGCTVEEYIVGDYRL